MSNEQKTLTITLTGRNPVQIDKEEWPILAHANGDSYGDGDGARRWQALARGECDRYRLTVRQHQDKRAIVYGVLDAAISAWGAGAGGVSRRGGELVQAGGDVPAAVIRVAEYLGLDRRLADECVADLPAVRI